MKETIKTDNELQEVKSLKISLKHHNMLKKYCDKRGLKIFKVVETLIEDLCDDEPDIYGDD